MTEKTYRVLVRESQRPWYSRATSPMLERYALADELPPGSPRAEFHVDAQRRTWIALGLGGNASDLMRRIDEAARRLPVGEHVVRVEERARPYVAVRVDLDPETCGVARVVDGRGEGLQVDARRLVDAVVRTVGEAADGLRMGGRYHRGAPTVALPVELYMVAGMTCFPSTGRSVLEVVAEHLRPLGVSEIVAEHPPGPWSVEQARLIELGALELRQRVDAAEKRGDELALKLQAVAAELSELRTALNQAALDELSVDVFLRRGGTLPK